MASDWQMLMHAHTANQIIPASSHDERVHKEHEPMSWDEEYASHYDAWSAHMTADVAFYISLAPQANGPLVELAIGNGRVAIPVALATGRRVIGIDSSPAMLE
jgi:ubiquinone/menaquinone biosynthesis C-methylase UbiE